ncbi:MAG TPA: hypothetical protein QF698_00690, partial [Candidatus Marinimicrobia bacterium]|nr:hypothetical protein [Candidatus Neomarinimicrobiota bacterium]
SGLDTTTVIWGDNNIDIDPFFVDTANGNYHLLATSQLINAGHPDSTDSDGTRADIGAYPYLNSYSGPTWYISESGTDTTATGASGDPFRSIQAGINFSSNTDSVTVAPGTYVENINFRGRNIEVVGEDRETTIIDGDSSGSVVIFSSGEDSTTVLSGFTIQNGMAINAGGLFISYSSPTLNNLTVVNNTASHNGAGFLIEHSNAHLDNIYLRNNISGYDGGGLQWVGSDGGSPMLKNMVVDGNTCFRLGGGLNLESVNGIIINNILLVNNTATVEYGGGMWINGNSVPDFTYKLDNVSVINNNSPSGGGIAIQAANVDIVNSIFQNNSEEEIGFSSWGPSSHLNITYSNIENGMVDIDTTNGEITWGDGNIDVDPMFVDSANGNYHLLASSQLINAGHPDSTDADGTIADIGAYPYLTDNTEPVWYINTAGNDTTGTGTSVNPFASIQAGINFS